MFGEHTVHALIKLALLVAFGYGWWRFALWASTGHPWMLGVFCAAGLVAWRLWWLLLCDWLDEG